MSASEIIGEFFPSSNQAELLRKLVENGKDAELSSVLKTIRFEQEALDEVAAAVTTRVVSLLNSFPDSEVEESKTFQELAELTSKLTKSVGALQDWIVNALDNRNEVTTDINLAVALDFLEKVYTYHNGPGLPKSEGLDRHLISLICGNDQALAECSSRIIKWKITDISDRFMESPEFDAYVWDKIPCVLAARNDSWSLRCGYLFLLRSLMQDEISEKLHLFITQDTFWECLQHGLGQGLHDVRKYALSVLKLSLQKIPKDSSFTNRWIKWTPNTYLSTLETWRKFSTLYEIVALDTSLNQLEAASADILDLFESEVLNPRWTLIIFKTGIEASMESVRRHIVKLMLQVKNKAVFQTSGDDIADFFLPAAMYAPYFAVVGDKCAHGETLSEFVKHLVVDTNEQASSYTTCNMVSSILHCLYQHRASFDPARIYISLGLYNALTHLKAQILDESNILLVAKLFEAEAEEEVFDSSLQIINLKLLMHIKMDVSPEIWITALSRHIKAKNGSSKFISPLLDDLIDTAVKCFDKREVQELLPEAFIGDSVSQAVSYILFGVLPEDVDANFLIELVKLGTGFNGFEEKISSLFSNLISASLSNSEYKDSEVLAQIPIFGPQAWNQVSLDRIYRSLIEDFDVHKFAFFVQSFHQTVEHSLNPLNLDLQDMLKFYDLIKNHCQANCQGDFRYRDEVYGNYFNFLLSFLKYNALNREENPEEDQLSSVLKIMELNVSQDNGNYKGNLAVVKVAHHILDNYILPRVQDTESAPHNEFDVVMAIVNILCRIWDDASGERLILVQRELHLSFIKTLFHPIILFFALTPVPSQLTLAKLLLEYGNEIISNSYSRRSLLPTLGQRINVFMETYGRQIDWHDYNHDWLVELMIKTFIQNQMAANIYKLKPILAHAFDMQVDRLRGSSSGLYERVYTFPEVSARVFIVSALLHANDQFRQTVLVHFMEKDENLLKAKKSTDGAEEMQRLLKWQLLLITVKSTNPTMLNKYVDEKVLKSVMSEASPLVRVYSEWVTAIDVAQTSTADCPSRSEDVLFDIMSDQTKPLNAVTAERILFVALKSLSSKANCQRFLQRFISKIIPNCTSNKPLIRHFSNSLMLSFWPSLEQYLAKDTLRSVLENLFKEAQKIQVHGQYRMGDAIIWDLENDFKLTNIFGGTLMKSTDHEVPYINSATFRKYMSCLDRIPIGEDEPELWLEKRAKSKSSDTVNLQKDSPIQTKSGAWETVMDIDNQKQSSSVKRTPLIVVASLVDKAPNLGGICRLCDVLGAGLLTVHDLRVKNSPQFKSVAVTADRWMPMDAVPVEDIAKFMRLKKQEGYTLVGLEQTDKSIQLNNSFQFPVKTLILLGTEAEGIPGTLLSELDLCLEIKQSGVIRSMNIQTATAVIVHSYSAQHA